MAKRIQDLTNIGNITTSDKVVVERVAGQTRTANFRVELSEDLTPQLGGNLDVNGKFIVDANNNEYLKFVSVASAVNELTVTNAATATDPSISATGANASIGIKLIPKDTGQVSVAYLDTRTNTTVYPFKITALTTGSAAANIGAGYSVELENGSGGTFTAGTLAVEATTVTAGAEVTAFVIRLATSAAIAERYRFAATSSTGSVIFTNAATAQRTLTIQDVTGTIYVSSGTDVIVADGGTGRSSATAYAPLCGGTTTTGAHQSATSGSTGQLFVSQGSAALPTWTTPTYPTASGTAGKILRADGTNNVYTTATFADTYSASVLLYSNGANTVTGLATANSGVLVTSGAGVPSIATDIPTAVTIGGAYNYRAGGTDIPVADGGTGLSATTAYAVLCGGTTSTAALQSIASVGTAGQVLTSNGAGALPTMQANVASNLVGCFKAYKNGTQALGAATFTKVTLSSEDFDVSGVFDSATNYRHTPTTAGKYTYVGSVYFAAPAANDTLQVVLYKNGAAAAESVHIAPTTGNQQIEVTAIFDMNGSTDYIELYAYRTSAGNIGAATNYTTTLHGFLIG